MQPVTVTVDLAALGRGDPEAWRAVVAGYGPVLAAVARSMRLSESESADVVQTTWLVLLENAGRIEDPTRLRSWLVTVARREALRLLRYTDRQRPVAGEDYFDRTPDPAGPADEEVLRTESRARLHRAIEAMPVRSRRLLHALMADPNASYADLAVETGIPPGSIGPTRVRCLRILRAVLA